MISWPDGLDPDTFLQEYWQKKPLLIPGGLRGFHSPLEPDELAGLALEEEVESRLVMEHGRDGPWELRHGPFTEKDFQELPATPWTLLVQGVDLWVPEVRAIMDEFPFLPRWKMDDVMVSFANDGGSVGPHFDYYDVFLIQGHGKRRWSIGGLCDETTPLLQGTPLKILNTFSPQSTWELAPGDILYLPPCVAHHGVAMGESMTYSLGFRSPTAGEMLDDLATEILSHGGGHYYRDPPLASNLANETIHPAFVSQARKLLLSVLNDEQLLAEWFACYMTRPKYPHLMFDDPALERRAKTLAKDGEPSHLFINGMDSNNGE